MEDKEPRIRKQKVVLVNGKIIYKKCGLPSISATNEGKLQSQ
jgi:hypothetical protein